MITLDIDKCVWVPSSKTLIAPKQEVCIAGIPSTMICIVGFKVDIYFFWDSERRVYKFDKIYRWKAPPSIVNEQDLKQILIVVV